MDRQCPINVRNDVTSIVVAAHPLWRISVIMRSYSARTAAVCILSGFIGKKSSLDVGLNYSLYAAAKG